MPHGEISSVQSTLPKKEARLTQDDHLLCPSCHSPCFFLDHLFFFGQTSNRTRCFVRLAPPKRLRAPTPGSKSGAASRTGTAPARDSKLRVTRVSCGLDGHFEVESKAPEGRLRGALPDFLRLWGLAAR